MTGGCTSQFCSLRDLYPQIRERGAVVLGVSTDMLVRASACNGDPCYLLTARTSIFDALSSDYPVYSNLKAIALVPGACVFKISLDGAAYPAEAEKKTEVLPSLAG